MDYFLFQQINNLAGKSVCLDSLAIFLAGYFQYILSGLLIVFVFVGKDSGEKNKNRLMVGLAFLAAALARLGLAEIIKRAVARPRPFEIHQVSQLIPYDPGFSFPSGHAAFFFAFSAVVYFYNQRLGWLFFAGSLLMGLARIWVGVHYPLDILAGALLGIFTGWLVVRIFRWVKHF